MNQMNKVDTDKIFHITDELWKSSSSYPKSL